MAIAQKITAQDLLEFKVIDAIIKEPIGGAHRQTKEVMDNVSEKIEEFLADFEGLSREEIKQKREEKFLTIGENL